MRDILIVNKDITTASGFMEMVDWGRYDFRILGICSNGIQAMELIFRKMPDIVFISLDLPGLGGLDIIRNAADHGLATTFVITQETGDFESAQAAMKLGVREYLVYPIKTEDLTEILENSLNDQSIRHRAAAGEYTYSTGRLLRNSFMHSFITAEDHRRFSIYDLNSRYNFTFREGFFQAVIVQFKNLPADVAMLPAETVDELRVRFAPACSEMIPYAQGSFRLTLILNYSPVSPVQKRLPEIENTIGFLLKQHNCTQSTYSVGVGTVSTNVNDLLRLIHSAERAAYSSVLRGSGRTYYFDELVFDPLASDSVITQEFLYELDSSAELMDFDRYEKALLDAFGKITPKADPEIMVRICEASAKAAAKACDESGNVSGDAVRKVIHSAMNASSLTEVKDILLKNAREKLEAVRTERGFSRPVFEAVKYIRENFTQNITLDNVAEHVHLNASYLSMLFKKETGMNYIAFLTDCRIDEAKRLLENSGLSVAEICYAVGYTDKKYFSRLFTGRVGIHPTEYRSIH